MAKKDTTKTTTTDLATQLADKQQDLLQARRSHASGELVNPRVLRSTRKEIARLKTALRANELTTKNVTAEGGNNG